MTSKFPATLTDCQMKTRVFRHGHGQHRTSHLTDDKGIFTVNTPPYRSIALYTTSRTPQTLSILPLADRRSNPLLHSGSANIVACVAYLFAHTCTEAQSQQQHCENRPWRTDSKLHSQFFSAFSLTDSMSQISFAPTSVAISVDDELLKLAVPASP